MSQLPPPPIILIVPPYFGVSLTGVDVDAVVGVAVFVGVDVAVGVDVVDGAQDASTRDKTIKQLKMNHVIFFGILSVTSFTSSPPSLWP